MVAAWVRRLRAWLDRFPTWDDDAVAARARRMRLDPFYSDLPRRMEVNAQAERERRARHGSGWLGPDRSDWLDRNP
jgi:hypothetical protein